MAKNNPTKLRCQKTDWANVGPSQGANLPDPQSLLTGQ